MRYQDDHGPPMFTYAALAAFIAFFGAQYQHFDLTRFFAFPWRVADGELWRLITCTFLHGSLMHIAFNLVLFLRFSTVIDNWLGPWAALFLYALLALSSNAAQLLTSPAGVIGASGVVYGLFGFLWVMSRRRDDAADAANLQVVQTMIAWLAICAVINFFGGAIGNTAHVWGLLVGWLIGQTFVARKRWRIPLVLASVVVWALPLIFIQRPVWDHTLAHVPPFNRWYFNRISPHLRDVFEDPENAPDVGLISTRHREH
jgi:membrane associated rhomboid family serine protease